MKAKNIISVQKQIKTCLTHILIDGVKEGVVVNDEHDARSTPGSFGNQ